MHGLASPCFVLVHAPAVGLFKDKREQLSSSFLGRFQPVTFQALPDEEWQTVRKAPDTPHLTFAVCIRKTLTSCLALVAVAGGERPPAGCGRGTRPE